MAPAERYGYSVARLRAMENRLLDEALFQRLIESDGLDSAIKILGETVYAPWLMEMKSNEEFDSALGSELTHVYTEVSRFAPDEELVQICRLPYDFHNVKVLIKSVVLSRQGGERRFDLLTPLGNVETDSLVMAVESEEYRLLPFGLNRVVPQALSLWEQNHDMVEVECLLDSSLFEAMEKLVKALSMADVERWFRRKVDGENIRTLVRLHRMGMDSSYASKFLHSGGSVSVDRMISVLSEPLESWGRLLAFCDGGSVFGSIQDSSDLDGVLMVFDSVLDDYVTGTLDRAKYSPSEPSNFLRYLWMKEMEVKNLRVILVSLSNNSEKERVRRLMRNVG